ncbi:unnamed protein product [Cochlearia groenlandica]
MEGGEMVLAKVKRETVVACMTCSLCDNLLRDATTISECLHTFCRKCIYEKITEDEIESCPVCDIDLGGAPLEKLRPDHILQDLRAKLFPLKRSKERTPEVVSSTTLPATARRKERSISSLVVSTPRVSAQAGTTGKRTKSGTRKDARGSGSFTKRTVKKEEDFGDDHAESGSSPETLKKFTQGKRQSSYAEPNQSLSNRRNKDVAEPWDSKLHLWKPLDFLVDVANGTKPSKSSCSHGADPKSEHGNASHNGVQGSKTKTKNHKRKCKPEEEISNNGEPTTSETAMLKKTRRTRRKRSSLFDDSTPQLDAARLTHERRNGPVWFSLMASNNQEGETSLPQIPANYLRIRDGNIPVSFIQKYLVTKLDLKSENEVEIRCMGEPVIPTLQLHSLVELWLQTTSKHERVTASIGSSAKEFVMVLVYARKLPGCNNETTV